MARVFTITEGLENMGALRTGGQGSVYKGRRMGQIITAVKLLPTPIHAEDENDKNFKDFQNEVEKLKKVNQVPNPNVVKILSSGITESGSLPFIEMEFIEGPDLEDLLKPPHDTVFTIREAIKVADQLSNALAHCHKVDVKHGDIKSNNVKFNVNSGNYMLLDFGLAIMSDEQRRTSLRHAGAIEFMAPEQNSGEMLFETDVYSFGVILFELLAGVVPFPLQDNGETSRNAVMISHLETQAPDILALREKNLPQDWAEEKKIREMRVPGWLLGIISKCLEKRPENRFKSGTDLHNTIVTNSISPVDGFQNDDITVLQNENERLKTQLMQYQQASTIAGKPKSAGIYVGKSDGISNSWGSNFGGLKPVVIGVVILLACLSLFAGYSIYSGSHDNSIDTVALNMEKKRLRDSIDLLEKLNAKRFQDSIDAAKRYAIIKERIAEEEREEQAKQTKAERKQKRKRGFLGIRL